MKANEKNKRAKQPQLKRDGNAAQLSIAFGEKYMEVEIDIESFIMG